MSNQWTATFGWAVQYYVAGRYGVEAGLVPVAGNLLHHLERPGDALREMGRVARAGIAICEPNRNHVPMGAFGAVSSVCRGLLHYSRRTLVDIAASAGLRVQDVTLHGYVYENRSPGFSLPVARQMERVMQGGAYILMTALPAPVDAASEVHVP